MPIMYDKKQVAGIEMLDRDLGNQYRKSNEAMMTGENMDEMKMAKLDAMADFMACIKGDDAEGAVEALEVLCSLCANYEE